MKQYTPIQALEILDGTERGRRCMATFLHMLDEGAIALDARGQLALATLLSECLQRPSTRDLKRGTLQAHVSNE